MRIGLPITLLLIVAPLRPASGDLISSFETDLNGWVANDNTVTLSQDTTGATDGRDAVRVAAWTIEAQELAGSTTTPTIFASSQTAWRASCSPSPS